MAPRILDLIVKKQQSLALSASSILHKVDLKIRCSNSSKTSHCIQAEGTVRAGPFRSTIDMKAQYNQEETGWELKSFTFDAPGFGKHESMASDQAQPELIDPLGLLYAVVFSLGTSSHTGNIIAGNKVREYRLVDENGQSELMLKNESVLIIARSGDKLNVQLSKLRMNIKLKIDLIAD